MQQAGSRQLPGVDSTTHTDAKNESDPPSRNAEPDAAVNAEEVARSFVKAIRNWLKKRRPGQNKETLREALEGIIDDHKDDEQIVDAEERRMLRNLISFGELEVRDLMVPRIEVVAVPEKMGLEEIKRFIADKGHTRMPIYRDTLDNITGFLHVKDLIPFAGERDKAFNLEALRRDLMAVPLSMKAVDLLLRMRSAGLHMALVVDEYGGTDGIVTLEDLCERIIGDIHDEYDEDERPMFRRLSRQVAVVDARMDIELLEQHLNISLRAIEDKNVYDTLGGLIFTQLGHVPKQGERLQYNGLELEIVEADPRRIQKVRISKLMTAMVPAPRGNVSA